MKTATLSDAELLGRLVSFDSTSSRSNIPIADFICDYITHPEIIIARDFNEDRTKVNVVARLRGTGHETDGKKGLTLSGHLDTVPAAEPDWTTDPFTLERTEIAYRGRGVCDMKGFDALAINTLRRAADDPPRFPLGLILSFDEEPGILGAQHLARTWDDPFALPIPTIVGEPTCLKAVRMHKGHLKMRVTFTGKPAHTAYAHLGRNAIEPAGTVIGALNRLRVELALQTSDTSRFFPESPAASLNITMISGGTATNVVPDRCTLDFGIRLLPDMNPQEFARKVREAIHALGDLGPHSPEITGISAPFLTGEDTPLYQTLCKLLAQSATEAVSYASDAGALQQLGLQCVLFGPGSIEAAHQANEWLSREEFDAARGILDRLVQQFCRT